jgi:hypothetical protein
MRSLHSTRMLVQATAPTTAADWAQAYAELAKEKDAQLSVLTKKNRILTQENAVLAKEKDALAKEKNALAKEKDALANELAAAISQCNARGSSIGLLGMPVALVCESLSRRGTVFLGSPLRLRCVQWQQRSMPPPRCRRGKQQQQVPSPAPRHGAPFELDRVRAAACLTRASLLGAVAARRAEPRRHASSECAEPRRHASSEWLGAATKEHPAGARRPAPSAQRQPRSAGAADRRSRLDRLLAVPKLASLLATI